MQKKEFKNTAIMFFQNAAQLDSNIFLSQRDTKGNWRDYSWKEAEDFIIKTAKALKASGLKKGHRVIIASENRYEWGLLYMAIVAAGGIMVPVYTTNKTKDHSHIIDDSGASFAFVSNQKLFETFLPAAIDSQRMRKIITLDPIEIKQEFAIQHSNFEEFIKQGENTDFDPKANAETIEDSDVACLIYTSGTGGAPKGVMLEHRSLLHNPRNLQYIVDCLKERSFLSILPLSHAFEFTVGFITPIYYGGKIYYFNGLENILPSLQEKRPGMFLGVPRLLEMFKSRIEDGIKKGSEKQKFIFNKALELGLKKHHKQPLSFIEKLQFALLKQLVQKKISRKFGNLEFAISGGAALDPEVNAWLCAIGIPIIQGYGQTESAPVICANDPRSKKDHSVGFALGEQEIKIAPDGELLIKGVNVMRGYWNNDFATEEAIIDGWLHTGDVAEIDEDKHVIITGRKKDIIVLAGGDNISPTRIESLLTLQKQISQAVIYGDKQNFLSALIVPDEDYMKQWAAEHDVSSDLAALCQNKEFHRDIMRTVDKVSKELPALEKIRKIAIAPENFTQENGLLTATLKVRRQLIIKQYQHIFDSLYQK